MYICKANLQRRVKERKYENTKNLRSHKALLSSVVDYCFLLFRKQFITAVVAEVEL